MQWMLLPKVPDNFPMCLEYMYVVLGNLLENALEACARQKEEKRFIHIDVNALEKSNMAGMICADKVCIEEGEAHR